MTSKPLLAIETSVPTARVALLGAGGKCLAAAEKTAARHSANLLSLVDHVLGVAGVDRGDLRGVACGAGPGSFTGLRVGMAVAKGLALPLGLPLLLESSLTVLAQDLVALDDTARFILPCIDAGKGQIYGRVYAHAAGTVHPVTAEDWVAEPKVLCDLALEACADGRVVVGGSGVDRYVEVFRTVPFYGQVLEKVQGPSALRLGKRAMARLDRGEQDDLENAVPRYGRPPDITQPKKNLLLGGNKSPH
jgi:tRNA threonylcarbamoyladenosine biosynthesis protein TsaB